MLTSSASHKASELQQIHLKALRDLVHRPEIINLNLLQHQILPALQPQIHKIILV